MQIERASAFCLIQVALERRATLCGSSHPLLFPSPTPVWSLFLCLIAGPLFSGQTRSLKNYLTLLIYLNFRCSWAFGFQPLKTLLHNDLKERAGSFIIMLLLTITSLEPATACISQTSSWPTPRLWLNRVLKHPLPLFKELLFQGLTLCVHSRY